MSHDLAITGMFVLYVYLGLFVIFAIAVIRKGVETHRETKKRKYDLFDGRIEEMRSDFK